MAIPYPGETAALATAFCWAVSVMSFNAASRAVGSMAVNLIRLVLAVAMLSLYNLAVHGMALPLNAPPHTWQWLALSGLAGFFVGDLCLFRSFILVGPRMSTLLMSLSPPLAALLGMAVLGEHLKLMSWLGMAVTLLGVGWVVMERPNGGEAGGRHPLPPWGVTLGVLGALGQAVGMILAKKGMDQGDGTYFDAASSAQIRAIFGILGFATLFVFLKWYPRVFASFRNPRALGMISLGALAGPVMGVSLAMCSLHYIPTGVAQTIMGTLPVMIIPLVIVFHKERVSPRAVIGACVAVAGIAILFL